MRYIDGRSRIRVHTDERLIDRLFNGTSTQKGQFVPTAGKGNAQAAKDGQRDTMHNIIHDNNVTQFTVERLSYSNNRLSNRNPFILIITE